MQPVYAIVLITLVRFATVTRMYLPDYQFYSVMLNLVDPEDGKPCVYLDDTKWDKENCNSATAEGYVCQYDNGKYVSTSFAF